MAVCVLVIALVYSALRAEAAVSPVQVNVYYESLCPDSRQFFHEQLTPTYEKMPSGLILELVPYGNAHYRGKPDEYTFTCQHGPEECFGNIIQACYIELVNDTLKSLKFINCAFDSPTQKKSVSQCIDSSDLQSQVKKCATGPMGKNLMYQMAKKTDSLYPRHTFIPWITINGKGGQDLNDKAIENFSEVVCNEFTGEKPEACKKPLWESSRPFRYRSYYL